MNYSLNAGEWNSVFAVPSSVVDKYIKLAGGGSLKLLLFLLRHGGKSFTDAELKEALGFRREGELEDAALFWVQRGVIRAENGALSPVAEAEQAPVQMTLPETEPTERKPSASSIRRITDGGAIYTSGDIRSRISTDSAVSYLFGEAESLYGRPLKDPENRVILMLVDHYGLPAEVAALLLKYCFKVGKTSSGYIQTVAQSWADDGINTAAAADARLAKLEKRFAIEEQLRSAMEMTTKFTPKQLQFIKTWSEDWGFSADMILLAHEITLDNTGKSRFEYTNKILENWRTAGISTKSAAQQESYSRKKPARAAAKSSDSVSSFDANDIMSDILSQYRKGINNK